MDKFVLDASIALKWFFPQEKDSEIAQKILRKIKKGQIKAIAPQIFFFEVINVIKTKAKSTSNDMLGVINKIFSLNLISEKVDLSLLKRANLYAQKFNLSIYDASYIALADINKATFITADEKMARKVNLKFVKSLKEMEEV